VYLASPDNTDTPEDETVIVAVPRDRVELLSIYPPPNSEPPRESIASRLTPTPISRPFSVTPLTIWWGMEYYSFRLFQ